MSKQSVSNKMLASDTARANLLTNGGFEIWQRGNGPFTGTGTGYCADRWALYAIGGPTFSCVRDSANAETNSGACASVTVAGGPTAGNPASIYQYPMHPSDTNQ